MIPRSERILIEETPVHASSPPSSVPSTSSLPHPTRSSSVQRLTSLLHRSSSSHPSSSTLSVPVSLHSSTRPPVFGSKKDIWIIEFSDVAIRCQRTGTTNLPSSVMQTSFKKGRSSKDSKGTMLVKERNLYRFLNVERWTTVPIDGDYQQRRRRNRNSPASNLGASAMDDSLNDGSESDDTTRDGAESQMR